MPKCNVQYEKQYCVRECETQQLKCERGKNEQRHSNHIYQWHEHNAICLFFHVRAYMTSAPFFLSLDSECARYHFFSRAISLSNEKISKLHPMKIYVYICGAVILTR